MPLSSVVGAQSIVKPGVCTSSTRPASPYDGQVIYETDTNRTLAFNGSTWDILSDMGAWTSYTPVIKGGATTVTATIVYAKYVQIGKTVILQVQANVTSAGAASGRVTVSLPSTLPTTISSDMTIVGSFSIKDSGTAYYSGSAWAFSTTTIAGIGYGSVDAMGVSNPAFTLASGDTVSISIMYEVA